VVEPEPPPGEAAIEWMLVTSEPVQTLEDAAAIVDHYRARWLIEEYFKALKTGCAFEKRQLMHLDGLVRALASSCRWPGVCCSCVIWGAPRYRSRSIVSSTGSKYFSYGNC